MNEPEQPEAKQAVKNSSILGRIDQLSDTANTEQNVEDVSARDLKQEVAGKQQALRIGNYAANGKWAIFALLVILIAYLAFNYLGKP